MCVCVCVCVCVYVYVCVCVKQHEVNRQVREPLTAKYKDWKRETKQSKYIYIW